MTLIDNLVSYWKLDEASGTRDDAHSTNDLTANGTGGVGSAAGKISNAADIEAGDSDYLSITDAAQSGLDFSSTFSVSAWVNRESAVSFPILMKDNPGLAANRSWGFWVDGSGALVALIGSGSGTFDYYQTATAPIGTATWYHIAVTADAGNASATTFEFFVNGSSIGNGTAVLSDNLASIGNGGADVTIGRRPDGGLQGDGLVDEVGVWSRVLTGTEISELYNSGSGFAYPFGSTSTNASHRRGHLTLMGVG